MYNNNRKLIWLHLFLIFFTCKAEIFPYTSALRKCFHENEAIFIKNNEKAFQ